MSEKLDKLRASLEKERERRIKINNRIESLERRIQEAEAAEVNEMVRTAKVTPEQLAALLRQSATTTPTRLRCPRSVLPLIRRTIPMKMMNKFCALMLSMALCAGMAAPAFAYGGEYGGSGAAVQTSTTDEEDVVTVTDEESGALTPEVI